CVAERADDLLMWAHYGDCHRGVCIGFARDSEGTFGRTVLPVEYREDYPRLTAANFDPSMNPNSFDQLWLTKAAAWRYEREWRICQTVGDRLYEIDAP